MGELQSIIPQGISLTLSRPGPVKKKPFVPKNNLPRLDDYSVDPPESYWESWPKVLFSESDHKSWLNPQEFMDTAIEAGYKDMNHVLFIKNYLEEGADIGCEREGRLPIFGRNDVSVGDHGFEVADEIVSWLKMSICVGPLTESELPFTDYTVSPLTTRIKPN